MGLTIKFQTVSADACRNYINANASEVQLLFLYLAPTYILLLQTRQFRFASFLVGKTPSYLIIIFITIYVCRNDI